MDTENDRPTEYSPLLRCDGDEEDDANRAADWSRFLSKRRIVPTGAFTMRMLLLLGTDFVQLPIFQLQEDILCRQFNSTTPAPGTPDGDPSWTSSLVPTLLAGVPMGIIADRYGRSIVLVLSLLGIPLTLGACVVICAFPEIFPLRLIWLTPILALMGGGEVTFLTVSYTMVADVTEEAERSMVFSLMNGGFTIVGMASKPLTYLLLKRSPWLSIYAGLAVLAIAVVVSFCLPETLQKEAVTNDASERSDSEEEVLEGQPLSSFQQAWAQIRAGARQFLNFLHLLVAEERQVGVLLLSLLFTTFGMDAALMLIQYAHARFGLGWGEAGILSSIQDVVDLVLFTVLVPLATRMLLHYRIGSRTKDLWLARVSGIIQVLGSAIIGLAPTPAALVAGVGISGLADSYGFFLRSLMTSLMGRDTGILYTAIGLLSSLGIFIANPLLSALFRRGIDIGGPWVGLPFLAAAMLFAIALSMIAFIRVDDSEDDDGSLRGHEDSVQHVE